MLIQNLFKYWTYQVFSPGTVLREKYEAFKMLLEYDKTAHEFMASLEDIYYAQKKHDFQTIVKTYDQMACSVSNMVDELLKMCPASYWDLKDYFKKFDSYNRFMLAPAKVDTAPPFTTAFSKALLLDENITGKKAFCLSVLNQNLHLPAPNGFVITTNAFHYFLAENMLHQSINEKLASLDISSPSSLELTSGEIQNLILNATIPKNLAVAVTNAIDSLKPGKKNNFKVALRSSAVKEDGKASFAGQYDTLLDVSANEILNGYKKIIAGKYSSQALYYRISHGILDDETPMAVLILEMIDSKISGVIYTNDLKNPLSDNLSIHCVQGRGGKLVDGKVSPDVITVSKSDPHTILDFKRVKNKKMSHDLDDASVITLARWGVLLEDHFGMPQDIEWAQDQLGRLFVLQSRPLNIVTPEIKKNLYDQPIKNHTNTNKRLCLAKESVCFGVASGPVHRIEQLSKATKVPEGSVVVIKYAPPQLVTQIHNMSAIVIETGSRASHFSSIAREFGVPAIVNIDSGFDDLTQGRLVTVDANQCMVYDGPFNPLVKTRERLKKTIPGKDIFKDSSFMRKLRYIINFSVKLKFTDPESKTFIPQACRSLHDIIRFTHETAMQEMFLGQNRKGSGKKGARKLILDIPMIFYVLDVGEGIKKNNDRKNKIKKNILQPEDVAGIPMKAVLKGLLNPDICWKEASHFDWEEYDKIVMAGGIISPDSALFGSYAIVSKDYLNINFRFGYHFVILDAMCTTALQDNYILFRFSGGGGSPVGRNLRANFIKGILERLGFIVTIKADLIDAQLKHASFTSMKETLDMIGRLLGATKLMDMYLKENANLTPMIDEFMNGRYDFRSIPA